MDRRRKLKKGKAKQPSRKISWSVLPSDVEENILSRLPVKSLIRFRCVCKHWCNLVTKPHFSKMQLNRSTQIKEASKLAYVSDGKVYTLDVGACGKQYIKTRAHKKNHGKKVLEVSARELVLPFRDQKCEILGSCNGLLCLSALDSLCLLNPSTKEFEKLPYPEIPVKRTHSSSPIYGFGYCPRTDEYKVVMIIYYMIEEYFHSDGCKYDFTHSDVCVYTFGTNSSWRSIGGTSYRICPDHVAQVNGAHHALVNGAHHALVNGALHWIASGTPGLSIVPISFELGDEKFMELSLPKSFSQENTDQAIGLVELGGFLSLYHCESDQNFDIWVMKDYGNGRSWTKKFSVAFPRSFGYEELFRPLCILEKDEVVLYEDEIGFFILDVVKKENLLLLDLRDVPCTFRTKMYLESLVSLRTDGGVDGTNEQEKTKKERRKISRGGKKHLVREGGHKPQLRKRKHGPSSIVQPQSNRARSV